MDGKALETQATGESPKPKRPRPEAADVVRLDVGGQHLVAPRGALAAEPAFLAWLAQRDSVALNSGGRIMMDGDGAAMADALAFFAEGALPPGIVEPLVRSRLLALTQHVPMPNLREALKATVAAPRPFVKQSHPIPAAPPDVLAAKTPLARLDFGNKAYTVRRDVLERQGGMLASLCNYSAQRMDAGETIELEEDGETFATAYVFMCDGVLPPPPLLDTVKKSQLRSLAKNWCLDGLLHELEVIYPLREAICAAPQQWGRYYALADALASAGREREAGQVRRSVEAKDSGHAGVEHYERLAKERPAEAWVQLRLGKLYCRTLRCDLAVAALRQACAISPKDAEAHTALADVWLHRNQMKARTQCLREAIEALRAATACPKQFSGSWQKLGDALYEAGDLDAASDAFSQALTHDSDPALAHDGLARVDLGRGNAVESARAHAELAVQLAESPSAEMYATLGAALLAATAMSDLDLELLRAGGHFSHILALRRTASEATNAYARASKLQRTRAHLRGQGAAYLRQNELSDDGTRYLASARRCLLAVLTTNVRPCTRTIRLLLQVYTRLGDSKQVAEVHAKTCQDYLHWGMDFDDGSQHALDVVRYAFSALGEPHPAGLHLWAARLEPRKLSHYVDCARAGGEVERIYGEAVQALPQEAAPHLAFGDFYLEKGALARARDAYDEAHRVAPSAAGWHAFSRLAAAEGNTDERLRALTLACGGDSRNAVWHLERAHLLEQTGLHAAAQRARNWVSGITGKR